MLAEENKKVAKNLGDKIIDEVLSKKESLGKKQLFLWRAFPVVVRQNLFKTS